MSVIATDQGNRLANYSNFGHHNADIAAPGSRILSTILNGQARRARRAGGGAVPGRWCPCRGRRLHDEGEPTMCVWQGMATLRHAPGHQACMHGRFMAAQGAV